MKLVDILARELKAWPEVAGYAYSSGHLARFSGSAGTIKGIFLDIGQEPEDHMSALVTRAEWQSAVNALNAPKVVEWDGEDTPAVGVICEFHESTSGWNSAVVKYSSDHCVVLERDNGYEVCIFTIFPSRSVRPIRTAEQVAAEERKSEILEMIDTFGTDTAIWGRDAVMEICGHLWESGYRKEPKPCGS